MAIVACSAAPGPAPASDPGADAPSGNDDIGEVGDYAGTAGAPKSDVVEAPVGGPVTDGANSSKPGPSAAGGSTDATQNKSGAAELKMSGAVAAGAAAVAAGFLF